jgi:hypothetical protein
MNVAAVKNVETLTELSEHEQVPEDISLGLMSIPKWETI